MAPTRLLCVVSSAALLSEHAFLPPTHTLLRTQTVTRSLMLPTHTNTVPILRRPSVRVPSLRSEYAQTLKPATTGLLSAPGSAIPENLATPTLSYLQSRKTTALDSKGMPPPAERFALSPYHSLRHSPTARRVSTSPYRYKKTNGNSGLRNRPEDGI